MGLTSWGPGQCGNSQVKIFCSQMGLKQKQLRILGSIRMSGSTRNGFNKPWKGFKIIQMVRELTILYRFIEDDNLTDLSDQSRRGDGKNRSCQQKINIFLLFCSLYTCTKIRKYAVSLPCVSSNSTL